MITSRALTLAAFAYGHHVAYALATTDDTIVIASHASQVTDDCSSCYCVVVETVPARLFDVRAVLGY